VVKIWLKLDSDISLPNPDIHRDTMGPKKLDALAGNPLVGVGHGHNHTIDTGINNGLCAWRGNSMM
jgi:hypothetical protein